MHPEKISPSTAEAAPSLPDADDEIVILTEVDDHESIIFTEVEGVRPAATPTTQRPESPPSIPSAPVPSRAGRTKTVRAEVVEDQTTEETYTSFGFRQQARLACIVALGAIACSIASLVYAIAAARLGEPLFPWVFVCPAAVFLAASGLSFVALLWRSSREGESGHATEGLILNVVAVLLCLFTIAVFYGLKTAREKAHRPPPRQGAVPPLVP